MRTLLLPHEGLECAVSDDARAEVISDAGQEPAGGDCRSGVRVPGQGRAKWSTAALAEEAVWRKILTKVRPEDDLAGVAPPRPRKNGGGVAEIARFVEDKGGLAVGRNV